MTWEPRYGERVVLRDHEGRYQRHAMFVAHNMPGEVTLKLDDGAPLAFVQDYRISQAEHVTDDADHCE